MSKKRKEKRKGLKRRTKKRIRHTVTIVLIVVSVLFSVFRFAPIFSRVIQAILDAALSIAYYFLFLFGLEGIVTPTVKDIPVGMDTVLPLTIEEFKILLNEFWILFKHPENFKAYIETLGQYISTFSYWFMILLLPAIIVYLVAYYSYKAINRSRKDTQPLLNYKKIRKKIYLPIRNQVKTYFKFLKNRKAYLWILGLIWVYNLNLLTIVLEAIAWIFYVSMSLDYGNIFIQIAKFAVDFSVPIFFFPAPIWWVIGYIVFDWLRRRIGDHRLQKYADKNEDFLKKHPGALFVVEKQRSKKTSLLTTFKIILERYFRKKAKEKLSRRDKQFPHFRWRSIEEVVERCRKRGIFKTFENIGTFVSLLKTAYEQRNSFKGVRRYLWSYYGYNMNELFEYADSGYSMVYDNGTVKSSIFNTIEKYACLYMIYSQPTPLDTSNYAIREDFRFKDYGCFPIFDGDLFRSSKESEKYSQYSHIINFDPFRPGKAFDEKTRYDEAVEFGIGVVQEVAKERKNRYTQTGKKDDLAANQSNDLFELDTKMRGHVATIDNFDFWRWLFDDQRPDSLGADSKDLTTICQIKKTSDAKIVLPWFAIEELLYEIAQKIHDKIYDFIRNRKNSDTLLVYFMKMLFNPLFKLYDRVEARYSVYTSRIKTTDAMDKEVIGEAEKVYILSAMAYNDKFATDSCRTFYRRKHLHAKRSLNDRVQYKSLYPTRDEYRIQRSYFFEDMNETFDGENERKEKVQEALTQQSSVQTKQRGKSSKTGV